jgi:uncharacterized protein YciI
MKYPAIIVYCDDTDKIQSVRPTHREYLGKLRSEGKIAMSGPFTDDSGALIVYEAGSLDEARSLLQDDPFNKAGVFESYQIKEWNQVI